MKCPYCSCLTCCEEIMIGEVAVQTSPYKCRNCGAQEIDIYMIADGLHPTLLESEKGFFKSEHLYRHHIRKNFGSPGGHIRRRPLSGRIRTGNKST